MEASAIVRVPAGNHGAGFDAAGLVGELRDYFISGGTRSLDWRRRQLRQLSRMLADHETRFLEALKADLHKAPLEGWATEVSSVQGDIQHALKHVKKWMRRRKVATPMVVQPGKSYVQPEPLGVVLVIGAWNYPLQLALAPLVPAIAAGNCAVLKPSELAPATSALLEELLPQYLDNGAFRVVPGAVEETTALLEQRWDHILYTGGGNVGKIVMAAAAKHLTPVTLELGGKSPCIVADDADLEVTARRIAWGKFTNAGQTCIAPDYLLCTPAMAARLLPAIADATREMFGEEPKASNDYGRIVNSRHAARLAAYLEDGEAFMGGEADVEGRYIAPTILTGVSLDSAVMQEEIFGPILPVVEIESLDMVEDFVNGRDKPLALYVFSQDDAFADRILENCSSGNACVNDCMMFMAVHDLPFGGVGPSGMGAYHGEHGFKTFSHFKAVLKKKTMLDLKVRYAPFTSGKFKLLRKLR